MVCDEGWIRIAIRGLTSSDASRTDPLPRILLPMLRRVIPLPLSAGARLLLGRRKRSDSGLASMGSARDPRRRRRACRRTGRVDPRSAPARSTTSPTPGRVRGETRSTRRAHPGSSTPGSCRPRSTVPTVAGVAVPVANSPRYRQATKERQTGHGAGRRSAPGRFDLTTGERWVEARHRRFHPPPGAEKRRRIVLQAYPQTELRRHRRPRSSCPPPSSGRS